MAAVAITKKGGPGSKSQMKAGPAVVATANEAAANAVFADDCLHGSDHADLLAVDDTALRRIDRPDSKLLSRASKPPQHPFIMGPL